MSLIYAGRVSLQTTERKARIANPRQQGVVGGTASAIGGGKFANGAITGAYVMLLNHMMHGDGPGPEKRKTSNRPTNKNLNKLIPVAKTFAIDINIIVGIGGEESPIGAGIIFRGKDAGKVFTYTDAGFPSFGLSLSGAIEETNWFYSGDIKNFSINTFNGFRQEIEGNYGIFGAGIIWGKDNYGGYLIGVKASVGAGWPPKFGGDYNRGETFVH